MSLSAADFAVVLAAFHRHSVIRLRDTHADDAAVVELSARFGQNKIHDLKDYLDEDHPELMRISNIVENGREIGLKDSAIKWHSDMAYRADPNPISVLVARELPSWGGGTRFATMRAAYESLPEADRDALRSKTATHSIRQYAYDSGEGMSSEMQAKYPDVRHPLVVTHPVTGRSALYVSEGTTVESQETLDFLLAFSVRPEFVWTQHWRLGDIVVWDNRCVVHQQTPYDPAERRLLKRTTVIVPREGV
jgi:taurine dioxygenase